MQPLLFPVFRGFLSFYQASLYEQKTCDACQSFTQATESGGSQHTQRIDVDDPLNVLRRLKFRRRSTDCRAEFLAVGTL
jgi:hypothetical protein